MKIINVTISGSFQMNKNSCKLNFKKQMCIKYTIGQFSLTIITIRVWIYDVLSSRGWLCNMTSGASTEDCSLQMTHWIPIARIFSCDQAAIWLVHSVCLSVRLSVRPSHLFHHVPIIVSSWNFQELSPMTKVTSMQNVNVRGQRSRSQRSTPNLTVSGL